MASKQKAGSSHDRFYAVSVFFYGNIDRLKFFILTMRNHNCEFIANEKMNILLLIVINSRNYVET